MTKMKTKTKAKTKRLAVLDFETDPFKHGRSPLVFAGEIYDGEKSWQFWGDHDTVIGGIIDCIEQNGPFTLYAHNGGKFDFFYMLEHFEGKLNIVNGRILKGRIGDTELRDSYAIIPVPLAAHEKDSIDYAFFEASVRERYKAAILKYLHKDCTSLFKLVDSFVTRFGPKLTIGGTAMEQMSGMMELHRTNEAHDSVFRPFFFGGRVQCFEHGIIKAPVKVYDVNSMYPAVMKAHAHPNGMGFISSSQGITASGKAAGYLKAPMYFARIEADNYGALPLRTENGLKFDVERGEFAATSHEIISGIECGALKIRKVLEVFVPQRFIRFDEYVDTFIAEKIAAKKSGDKVSEIFSKLLLNSGYGKFGQNPDNFYDYVIGGHAATRAEEGFEFWEQFGDIVIFRRPSPKPIFHDVATSASITGAARAVLMRAIHKAERPIYCDTDSLICTALNGDADEYALGAWKLEAEGDEVAIAGRKLYCVYKNGEVVKVASKGAKFVKTAAELKQWPGAFTADRMREICQGETLHWKSDAPNFKLNGATKFVDRRIRAVYS